MLCRYNYEMPSMSAVEKNLYHFNTSKAEGALKISSLRSD